MSKNENPMTEWYWREVLKKGTLIKEYVAVKKTKDGSTARRLMDGLVILDGPFKISKESNHDIEGENVVVIQSKNKRLGMYLMGQAFFSRKLILKKKPKSARSVAVCREDDKTMRDLMEQCPGLEVALCPARIRAKTT
jgi:hypothetical protein